MRSSKLPAAALALAIGSLAAAAPAEAQGYHRRGWSPGAAAAVGILGGMAAGAAIASARPAYAAPRAYHYAAPTPAADDEECYVVRRRVWVPGWGWEVQRREICD